MSEINGAALDRWITGNYGEDQFKGCAECLKCKELFYPVNNGVDPIDTECFLCIERECDCGEKWQAINDPESIDWDVPDKVPDDCQVCRYAAKIEAVEDRNK